MIIRFLWIGKSKYSSYQSLIQLFSNRLKHYVKHEVLILKELKQKGISPTELVKKEGELFLSKIKDSDYVILLDENGDSMTSIGLSKFLQKRMNTSTQKLTFIIAGAYGADEKLSQRAQIVWSLSQLTLTHDMARIFLLEQVYRAFTILRGEKYHNE